jgi:uncharacterized sporulation protein YeaH/YhbH (DUF444 family)
VNRQRFLRRYHAHVKKAVAEAIKKRGITDIEHGEEISIPRDDISEPIFRHGAGGRQRKVLPGNREYISGDRIRKSGSGSGGGVGKGDPSDSGEGMDEFVFELTQEEYLDFMFEGLELPNLVKKNLKDSHSYKLVKGGYTSVGIPARLNVVQTLRRARGRRIALVGATKRKIRELEKELNGKDPPGTWVSSLREEEYGDETGASRQSQIRQELARLKRRLNHIPFLDDFDLRYNNVIEQPTPTTSAVMLCLMDVSGSMTQDIKDMAKRFFLLLYLFLKRNYQKIEVVFIRHHTRASEVDEEEFFYSRETGGTIVSSALELAGKIVKDRYPASDWNIYIAQASDGDNWADDSPLCRDLLVNKLLPMVQYYAYVEITPREHQALWQAYSELLERFPEQFAMQQIQTIDDIYPVFHDLFERKAE